jgi:hypothetical protein
VDLRELPIEADRNCKMRGELSEGLQSGDYSHHVAPTTLVWSIVGSRALLMSRSALERLQVREHALPSDASFLPLLLLSPPRVWTCGFLFLPLLPLSPPLCGSTVTTVTTAFCIASCHSRACGSTSNLALVALVEMPSLPTLPMLFFLEILRSLALRCLGSIVPRVQACTASCTLSGTVGCGERRRRGPWPRCRLRACTRSRGYTPPPPLCRLLHWRRGPSCRSPSPLGQRTPRPSLRGELPTRTRLVRVLTHRSPPIADCLLPRSRIELTLAPAVCPRPVCAGSPPSPPAPSAPAPRLCRGTRCARRGRPVPR